MKTKKLLSAIIVLAMVVSLLPVTVSVSAEAGGKYIARSWDETKKQVVSTEVDIPENTQKITADTTTLSSGWYTVDGEVTVDGRITVSGDVNLILKDDCKLEAKGGIKVSVENSLTIYAQSDGDNMGRLIADNNSGTTVISGRAGIGGDAYNRVGNITVHGGRITANGSYGGAGIGGGDNRTNEYVDKNITVTVYGGDITANGGFGAAGIGGGYNENGGTVTVNGGKVTATGGDHGAGIGSGYHTLGEEGYGTYGDGGNVTVNGGTVTAVGKIDAAGIGGGRNCDGNTFIMTGGVVSATGEKGAGIGGGFNGYGTDFIFSGGCVTAVSAEGAGIGIGYNGGSGFSGHHEFTVADGTVIKAGDTAANSFVTAQVYAQYRYKHASVHIHDYTGEYKNNGDGTHSRQCEYCEEYNKEEHIFNGGYKDNGDGTHSRQCEYCEEYNEEEHIFNGEYKDNGDGMHSQKCICGLYGNAAEHVFDGEYKDNGDGTHSQKCICGLYGNTAEHVFGGEYKDNGDGTHSQKCICGLYNKTAHSFVYGECACGLAKIEYLYYDDENRNLKTDFCGDFEVLDEEHTPTEWQDGKWYVVNGAPQIDGNVTVSGDVHLILTDECTLNVKGTILGKNAHLYLHAQSTGDNAGKLICRGNVGSAGHEGIDSDHSGGVGGAGDRAIDVSVLTIDGANVSAAGGNGGVGGNGFGYYQYGNIATPGGAGGNGGIAVYCENLTVNGGVMMATGGVGGNGGVGGEGLGLSSFGGVGGNGGIAISAATLAVNDGVMTATGGGGGAGGNGGSARHSYGSHGNIGGSGSAAISAATLTVNGGSVTASGGRGGNGGNGGAGNSGTSGGTGGIGGNGGSGNNGGSGITVTTLTVVGGSVTVSGSSGGNGGNGGSGHTNGSLDGIGGNGGNGGNSGGGMTVTVLNVIGGAVTVSGSSGGRGGNGGDGTYNDGSNGGNGTDSTGIKLNANGEIIGNVTVKASKEESYVPLTDGENVSAYQYVQIIKNQSWTSENSLPETTGTYILENDVTLPNAWNVPSDVIITIDLNGHTIKRDLTEAAENGYVISTSGNLTILDSSENKTGTITGGKNSGNGGGIYVSGGTLTMNEVTVSGNSAVNGGGIYVEQNTAAKLTLTYCKITGNTASEKGSGFCLNSGTTTLTDCEIRDNRSECFGGGFFIDFIARVKLNGCTVSGNSAKYAGGAFEMENKKCKLVLNNTSVTENEVTAVDDGIKKGGGIHFNNGSVTLIGDVVIQDNTCAEDANNICMRGNTVTFDASEMSADSNVGINDDVLAVISGITAENVVGLVMENGDHITIEGSGYTFHTPDFTGDYIINGDGTHCCKCKVCNKYSVPEAHIFDIFTDNEDDTHTSRCICGEVGETESHSHQKSDGKEHVCSFCGSALTHIDENKDGVCDICDEAGVEYQSYNKANKGYKTYLVCEYIPIDSGEGHQPTVLENGKWYVVDGSVTINGRINVSGEVNLVLKDGCSLTVTGGIQVEQGFVVDDSTGIRKYNTLTIFAQSQGTGSLKADAGNSDGFVGIGNNNMAGNIVIHGGRIEAKGGADVSGIGGYVNYGTVRICGGTVTATGGNGRDYAGGGGKGNGGGAGISASKVTIENGNVTVTGGNGGRGVDDRYGSAGGNAGSGIFTYDITIENGNVTASGGVGGNGGYNWANGFYAPNGANGLCIYGELSENINGSKTVKNNKNDAFIPLPSGEKIRNYQFAKIFAVHAHDFTGGYVDNGDGTHAGKCTICGVAGESAEHIFAGVYKDNGDGTHSQKCTICGARSAATEHTIVDGKCTLCTYPYKTITLSDGTEITYDYTKFVIDDSGVLKQYKGSDTVVVIPEGVKKIEQYILNNNEIITEVQIPASVEQIGYNAFAGCKALKTVKFAENSKLKSIQSSAFIKTGLTEVTIPASTEEIQHNVFQECASLTSVKFTEGAGLKIWNSTFAYCPFTEIDFPESVVAIGWTAFDHCEDLKSITVHWTDADKIVTPQPNAFAGITDCTLYVPEGTKELYENHDVWNQFTIVEMNSLTLNITGKDFKVTPNGENTNKGVVIVALYDNEYMTRLLDVKLFNDLTKPIEDTFNQNGYVRAMWWSDLDDIMPLCEAVGKDLKITAP